MTCMEAQSLITPFVNDKLTIAQLEEFLKHVNECPDCMEELEVYFALLTAMKQLDEDEEVSSNFKLALDTKLKESEEKILHNKIVHIRKRAIFFAVVCLIGVVSSWSVGVMEEVFTMSAEEKFNYFCLSYQQIDQCVDSPLAQRIVNYPEVSALVVEYNKQQEEAAIRENEARRKEEAKKRKQAKKKHKKKASKEDNSSEAVEDQDNGQTAESKESKTEESKAEEASSADGESSAKEDSTADGE